MIKLLTSPAKYTPNFCIKFQAIQQVRARKFFQFLWTIFGETSLGQIHYSSSLAIPTISFSKWLSKLRLINKMDLEHFNNFREFPRTEISPGKCLYTCELINLWSSQTVFLLSAIAILLGSLLIDRKISSLNIISLIPIFVQSKKINTIPMYYDIPASFYLSTSDQ